MDNLTEIKNIMIFWECDDHRAKLEGDRVVNGNVVEVFKQLLLSLLVKISKATSSEKQYSLATMGFIWDGLIFYFCSLEVVAKLAGRLLICWLSGVYPLCGPHGMLTSPCPPIWGTADIKR